MNRASKDARLLGVTLAIISFFLGLSLGCARRLVPSDPHVTFDPQVLDSEPSWLHQPFDGGPSKIYLGWGWYEIEKIEKTGPWAGSSWAAGNAALYFSHPVFPDAELIARCAPFTWKGAPPQTMTPSLNGVELPALSLPIGFSDLRVELPRRLLKPMNDLRLQFAYEDVPAKRIDSEDTRHIAAVFDDVAIVPRGGSPIESASLIRRDPGLGVEIGAQGLSVPLPAGRRCEARFKDLRPAGSAVQVSLSTRSKSGAEAPFWHGILSQLVVKPVDFDVAGDEPSLLHLETAGPAKNPPPRISFELSCDGAASSRERRKKRPDIFIYLIDTLRLDALGAHGSKESLTPRIDAFSRDGIVYEHAWSSSSWTLPATVSVLAGVYPFEHGVQQMGVPIPAKGIPWLPTELSRLGYETVLISQWLLGRIDGIDRGFDHYYLDVRSGATSYAKSPSEVARGLFWQQLMFRSDSVRPLFTFLHVVDPHSIYDPQGSDRSIAERSPGTLPDAFYSPQVFLAKGFGRNPADRAHLRALYDGEVLHADREFGAFLDLLRYVGLYDESLIVLLTDHGEEFYEHGGFDHGRTLYEEVLHIPLIIKYPMQRAAGTRVRTPVSTIDVMPTILRSLGHSTEALRLQGRLLPPLRDDSSPDRTLFAEVQVGRSGREGPISISAVENGEIKCLRNGLGKDRFGHAAPDTEVFNLANDPSEQSPLDLNAAPSSRCLSQLSTWIERAKEAGRREGRPEPKLSTEEIQRLRSLGYMR